jgi:hypothetical protein
MNIESQLIMLGVVGVFLLIAHIASRFERPSHVCDACKGAGNLPSFEDRGVGPMCPRCNGRGRIYDEPDEG